MHSPSGKIVPSYIAVLLLHPSTRLARASRVHACTPPEFGHCSSLLLHPALPGLNGDDITPLAPCIMEKYRSACLFVAFAHAAVPCTGPCHAFLAAQCTTIVD